QQAARCMDCGIPFCHQGCPVNNLIPDWNNLVYRDQWRTASEVLHSTNNFPEFTGRICPAPCETSCTLNIIDNPVTIKTIECQIVDRAWERGLDQARAARRSTGKRGAVVGSGPAGVGGFSALNRAGHRVTLFEKADRIGGLLRYGIPDFKMEKNVLDRRLEQMAAEGVVFKPNTHIGGNVPAADLLKEFDAILLTGGAENPRDLKVPGRELKGIHFAMDFLPQQNKRVAGDAVPDQILATGKRVVIIGGGDTGADCLGTCHRQNAKSVLQFEIMPMPPAERSGSTPWPLWPLQLRTESAHEEGGVRDWAVATVKFTGDAQGNVKQLHAVRVGPPPKFEPLSGSEFTIEADLVLLALGFTGPVQRGMIEQFAVELDGRGNVATKANYSSSVPSIFAAGDMRRGQSLVVWAISEGRNAARAIHDYLVSGGRAAWGR